MPVYNCMVPAGAVSGEQRARIARALTDIHCGLTGAPRNFVHVFFYETPPDRESGWETPYYLDAVNRAGRPVELVRKLKRDLTQAFAETVGIPAGEIGARIVETPAAWSMEDGEILPEPGEEDPQWYSAESAG